MNYTIEELKEILLENDYPASNKKLLDSVIKQLQNLTSEGKVAFEKWCDDSVIELCKGAKYEFFGFAPIAAYYFAKTTEIKTVRIVLSAKLAGVPNEIIRERVRDLYV